jgi:Ca2+-transporting ATPase
MSVFQIGLFSNKTMNKAFLAGLVLQLAVLLIPFLQPVFHIVPLTGMEWLVVVGLSFVPLIVSEIAKAVRRAVKSQ